MPKQILALEVERPDSEFQRKFVVAEEFYSATDVRQAVLDCFPKGEIPFTGLEYIQKSEDLDEARRLTQRTDVSRESVLEERIPEAESLPSDMAIHIFEKQGYLPDGEKRERQYGMMLESSDCGYIVNCFW
jgi:hypothetical protein